MLNEQFQNSLRELRKSKNLTQDELGEILGVSGQTIYKYESGITFPPAENLEKMLEFFHVDPNTLFHFRKESSDYLEQLKTLFEKEKSFQFSLGAYTSLDAAHEFLIQTYPFLEGCSFDFIMDFHNFEVQKALMSIFKREQNNAFQNGVEHAQ